MNAQLRFLLVSFLFFSFFGVDGRADSDDELFLVDSRRPANDSRSESDAVLTARGNRSPSPWALGISFIQNSALSNNDGSMQMSPSGVTSSVASDPDSFGLMETSTTLNGRVGYRLTGVTSLYANVGGSFQRGILDPALGVAFRFPLSRKVGGTVSLQGTLPLSQYSRDVSRITTLTGSGGTLYSASPSEGLFLGATGFLSYSFYRSDSGTKQDNRGGMSGGGDGMGKMAMSPMSANPPTTTAGMDMGAREIMRSGGNAFLGYQFNSNFGINTGTGISASYRDDGMTMWMWDVTVARAALRFEGLQASAVFSLMSDHMKNEGMLGPPTLPFLGFTLQYVFGNEAALGGAANAGCH